MRPEADYVALGTIVAVISNQHHLQIFDECHRLRQPAPGRVVSRLLGPFQDVKEDDARFPNVPNAFPISLLFSSAGVGQDLARYRDFQFGMSPESIATVLASWEDAQYSYNLFQAGYGNTFGLVAFSKKLDLLASDSIRFEKRIGWTNSKPLR